MPLGSGGFDFSKVDLAAGGFRPSDDRAIVSVLGADRVGIVAAVASALADHRVNILDIHQTLFGELFAMNMLVDLSNCSSEFSALRSDLDRVSEQMGLKIHIQREDVFRFMHRV
jgi:ACT domain-containing protein